MLSGLPGAQGLQVGDRVGVGDDLHGDYVAQERRDRERDAVDGDGALRGYVAGELGWDAEAQAPVVEASSAGSTVRGR